MDTEFIVSTDIWVVFEIFTRIITHAHWRDVYKFQSVSKMHYQILSDVFVKEIFERNPIYKLGYLKNIERYLDCKLPPYKYVNTNDIEPELMMSLDETSTKDDDEYFTVSEVPLDTFQSLVRLKASEKTEFNMLARKIIIGLDLARKNNIGLDLLFKSGQTKIRITPLRGEHCGMVDKHNYWIVNDCFKNAISLDLSNFPICSMNGEMDSPCKKIAAIYSNIKFCKQGCKGITCNKCDRCHINVNHPQYKDDGFHYEGFRGFRGEGKIYTRDEWNMEKWFECKCCINCYCQPYDHMRTVDLLSKIDNRCLVLKLSHMYLNTTDDEITKWFEECTVNVLYLSCSFISYELASLLTKCKEIHFESVLLQDGLFDDLEALYITHDVYFERELNTYDYSDVENFSKRPRASEISKFN